MDIQIKEITNYTPEIKNTIGHFLKLLQSNDRGISDHQLKEIISSENSYLFFAANTYDVYMGMLTVGIYQSPTGKKAWIEDVVVDETFRGQGIGENLIAFAIQFARQRQVDILTLTSSPARVAANNLYKKIGFQPKETNVYRMTLINDCHA
ncbi:ribosomal protein S18 acetylase RimI-like enzyme [Pedobacter cryoconitis]|uniref:Ribosomal protein S18 acetylase RimI-like enzyme n=1 Tax=Pedobacter cryoconitis TaxID=188932 RepID=A0A7W9DJK6_9SPHI|nr:GNAT family N-acetyltransferase [Pedobacter cryoconitis]MBB5620814.1 ribosomal protein S18 acetylase RimI-like enzyme [Pedobacter cryoconitis]MBB5645987.1 ribosomal protein S18 acetylase RimI-like enzyme [Pedobacter cryoconitis]